MKDFLNKLKNNVLLSDGAWGTMLFDMGLEVGECPESWNLKHRNKVLDIAKSYIKAGADIIGTNSFGATGMKLKLYGLEDKAVKINIEAASISREAAGNDKFVFGSVGPTGKILMMDEVSEKQVYETFSEQCHALEKGGVDAILIETMSALDEALLAIQAAKENTSLPVICTFSFEKTVDNTYRTMMGVSPIEMAIILINAGVDIIGTNCGNGFDGMIEICREIRKEFADILLLVQANAGMPQLIDGKNIFPEGPKEMANKIPQLLDLGVNIIGGCCGTNPAHISEFSKIIHE
ncbi:homocysteine S-methyltransferase family protein [Bacteroidota bacterium]